MFKINRPYDTARSTIADSLSGFLSPFFINGRPYLDSDHPQSEDYTALCQANALIMFSNINDLFLTPSMPLPQQVHILEQACQASAFSHAQFCERRSILSESLARAEMIPRHLPSKDSRLVDPCFLNDGNQEKLISRTYDTSSPDAKKHTVMEIEEYWVIKVIYNLRFHPLARFPGPTLWAVSRIPYALTLLKGDLTQRTKELHDRYGHVVRLAPNELSFVDPQAWQDIYTHRHGRPNFPKNPLC
ncbi:MAG: hypothetical protein Q9168_007733 [Polycauliona sp. 1 TL-2023]